MKETLEAQDRKIEEDRAKRKEYLEREEEKTQIVPANKAPTRTLRKGTQPMVASAPKIPTLGEGRTRTIWTANSDFHSRRAKNVAKAMPGMSEAYASYLQTQYGNSTARASGNGMFAAGQPRFMNPGAITYSYDTKGGQIVNYGGGQRMVPGGYPGMYQPQPQQYTVDGMGRRVTTAKVLTAGPSRNSFNGQPSAR